MIEISAVKDKLLLLSNIYLFFQSVAKIPELRLPVAIDLFGICINLVKISCENWPMRAQRKIGPFQFASPQGCRTIPKTSRHILSCYVALALNWPYNHSEIFHQ